MTQADLFSGTQDGGGGGGGAREAAHCRILASAGSGKTYQLTRRYLKLAQGGVPVHAILASTFTRLAAGEIRDRILMTLAEAASGPKGLKELRSMIDQPEFQSSDALTLLGNLARNVHRMQVRTLDGFFASIVRCFALELGMAPDAGIVDEVQETDLRSRAVQRLLETGDADQHAERLSMLTRGQSQQRISGAIDSVVHELYDIYRQSTPDAWRFPEHIEGRLSASALAGAIDQLESTDVGAGKRLVNALPKDCQRARSGDWGEFLSKGLAAVCFHNRMYYNEPLEEDLLAALTPIVKHAAAVLNDQYRSQTEATADLLREFHIAFEAVKREQRGMTFSDLVMSLTEVGEISSLQDVFYRIDGTLDHLLLDEFQDTSVAQWQALEPIAREIVSDETRDRSFFCVGDIKQSIYGWRGAAPDVLSQLPDLLFPAGGSSMQDDHLQKSYRSSPVIMNVANAVFENLTANAALSDHATAAEQWGSEYPTHETARENLPGYVELRTVASAEDTRAAITTRLSESAALIAELHDRAPHRTIGVLTRTNKAATRLLFELGPGRLDIDASGRGAAPPTDAPAVNAVLDLLRLADHPSDTVSAFNVATSPLGPIVGAPANFYERGGSNARISLAATVRQQLLEHGYGEMIARWTARLAPTCTQRESRRLRQVVELAEAFDANAERTCRPDEFVQRIEQATVTDFKPAPVQVMTIHKSKGLEFDIVVLCDLEGSLSGRAPQVVVEREHVAGKVTKACRWISEKLRPIAPDLEPLFAAHRTAQARESLCMLYVAMTRARRGLYMLINPPSKPDAPAKASLAGILRGSLADDLAEPETVLYRDGNESWLDEKADDLAAVEPAQPTVTIEAITLLPAQTNRPTRTSSPASSSGHTQTLAQRLEGGSTEAFEMGTAIHALFERITWIEDFADDDATLAAAVRAAVPRCSTERVETAVARFHTLLEHEDVRRILSRGDRPTESVSVFNERPFARMTDSGLQQGFIDRLVVESNGRATIIDFKTDVVTTDTVADHAEKYRGQLEHYRAAAADQLGLDPSSIDTCLVFTGDGIVVPVS